MCIGDPALKAKYDSIVNRAIYRTRVRFADTSPEIVDHIFYGANDIHPKHLAIWFAFADEAMLREAEALGHTKRIRQALLSALEEEGYPIEVLPEIGIGFVGKKEVDEGGPWIYFR
jgi:hypothetical protein